MADIKVGDEVRVFDRNGGGWPGTVVKIGRKYATIQYGRATETFQFNGRRANDAHGQRWFKTLDQVALDERRQRAEEVLKTHKIRLDFGHSLTLEQIEALADVARKF